MYMYVCPDSDSKRVLNCLPYLGGCRILQDEIYPDVIFWSPQGDSFVIRDPDTFTRFVLPAVFKHSNFAIFIRQLTEYGFREVSTDIPYHATPVETPSAT